MSRDPLIFADVSILVTTSSKNRQKLKIRYILNHLSDKSGWPLVEKVLQNWIRINKTRYPIMHYFLLTSAHFFRKLQNYVMWRHVTSWCRIVTKISENVLHNDTKVWSKFQVSSTIQTWIRDESVFLPYIEKYRKIRPTFNKNLITFLLVVIWTQFFLIMCKTKLN